MVVNIAEKNVLGSSFVLNQKLIELKNLPDFSG